MAENSVDIVIRGRDEASAEIRRIYQEMKQLGYVSDEARGRLEEASATIREQNQIIRLTNTSFRVQYSDARMVASALSHMGAVASHVTSMITAYNVAAIRVTEAQRDYQEALSETGPASQRTEEALQRLRAAQQAQQMTMISLIGQIPGLVAQLISLTVSLQAAGVAARGFWASIGPAGWAILGISALTGGIALWGAFQSQSRVPSGQTRPGEVAQIVRGGLMTVHEGEFLTRGAGINVNGPLMAVGKIEMNPRGMSVDFAARSFGVRVQNALRSLTTSTPL